MSRRVISVGYGTIILASSLFAKQANTQAADTLKPTPKTVAWGYYDAKAAPVLRVKSGNTVEIQTPVPLVLAQEEKHPIIYVKHMEPPLRYPPIARQARLHGTIVIKLTIAGDGTVLSTESTRGDKDTTGFEILRDAAEMLVKRWTFGCVGCPPSAPFEQTIRFRYNLDDENVAPDNRVVMNLPDEVTITTGQAVIDHGSDTKISKKRSH